MAKPAYRIALLPGDGVGEEVANDAAVYLRAIGTQLGVTFDIDEIPCGGRYYLEHGRDWPSDAHQRCADADAILLGAVGWPAPGGGPVTMTDAAGPELAGKMAGWSPVIGNRIHFDLYANIRPVKCYPGTKHGISGKFASVWQPEHVDMVIIRENTEGLYSGRGHYEPASTAPSAATTTAIDERVITRAASEKVIRKAFEVSRARNKGAPADGKKRVTCIVKNNVLWGCKLFYEVFLEVGKDYPDIEKDVAIVDAFAMFVLTQPERYDVCVTTNMFGDIITDLASVLQGGMGMAVGCNVGDNNAMFEPIHGSAPPLAGKDAANPMAMTLATAEMLRWLGTRHADARLVRAGDVTESTVASLIADGTFLTADLAGKETGKPRSAVSAQILQRALASL